jgi:hypothetical protein
MQLPALGRWLRNLADRIDYPGAPRLTGYSFTYETGEGIRFRDDGHGCPIAYLGEAVYERAHSEADCQRLSPTARVFIAPVGTDPNGPGWIPIGYLNERRITNNQGE